MKPFFLSLAAACLACGTSFAADDPSYPEWWYEMGLVNVEAPAGNKSPVNQGQLKNTALRAQAYLSYMLKYRDTNVRLGSEEWLSLLTEKHVEGFPNQPTLQAPPSLENSGDNWIVMNQGQGKWMAWGFYEILNDPDVVLFDSDPTVNPPINVPAMLALHNPGWNKALPWDSTDVGRPPAHKSPLLIGQLKFMFSLDLGPIGPGLMDLDDDGIDDRIEWQAFNSTTVVSENYALLLDHDSDLYAQVVEGLGGGNYNQFTSGSAWTSPSAPGAHLVGDSQLVLITPTGTLLTVIHPELTLSSSGY